jgi:hypothetical protein
VSVAAITLCVASQRVFIVVVISLSIQSGNFWIHPLTWHIKGLWSPPKKIIAIRTPGFLWET